MRGDEESNETTELVLVTEERFRELRELKSEGQSYDELLGLLVQEHRRRRLTESANRETEDGSEPQVRVEE